MKNKKRVILSVLGILGLVVVTLGITYAFFNYAKQGTTDNNIISGTLKFLYTEVDQIGAGIAIEDAVPTTDEVGKALTGTGNAFNFKIESTVKGKADIPYVVTARKKSTSTLDEEAIKLYLTEVNGEDEQELLLDTYANLEQTKVASVPEGVVEKVIYNDTVESNTTYSKNFRLRMWIGETIDYSYGEYNNKTFSITVNVYANGDRSIGMVDTTPVDTGIKMITANNQYVFDKTVEEEEEDKTNYNLNVPNDISTLDIQVIPNNIDAIVKIEKVNEADLTFLSSKKKDIRVKKLATVIGNINHELEVGINYFKVTITSSNQLKRDSYILKVEREKSSNTDIENLKVDDYEVTPAYSSLVNEYRVTVPYEKTSVNVSLDKGEYNQQIAGIGTYNLRTGQNEIPITVTAENGTERIIRVIVERLRSNDANINNVKVEGYTLTHEVDNIYSVTVNHLVNSIEIENISETEANVIGIGIKDNLGFGNNDYNITVISGNGEVEKDYIIRVIKLKDDTNNLSNLSLTSCTLSPEFNSELTEYSCIVENNITSTTVSASATSTVATISGTGAKTLSVGVNTINVVVTSQSGLTKTYTVIITRKPNSDATLKSLSVVGKTISPSFNKDTLTYTLTVPYSVDNINIIGEATEDVSNVDGLGTKVLNVGENSFNITVTAEDGITTRTYNLVVTRLEDTDTSLKSVSITGYNIVKVDNNNYTLTVENNVTEITINASTNSPVATISGTGVKSLNVGSNTFKLMVTSQSGIVTAYNIIVTRKASSDANLKGLTISGYTISPTFASTTTAYTATVPYSVTSVTVNPTVNNSEASYAVTGNTNLVVGTNTVNVVVTSGDKTTKTYTIIVTRGKDTVNTLKSLDLTSCTLSPTFASGTTAYSCTVENNVTSTTVSASATSTVATISGTGAKSLSVGPNTINVVVTSQTGSVKTYTVTVTRKANNDATLKALTISSGTLSPTFASATTSYTATVPYSVTSLTVTPTVNDSDATYTVSGNTNLVVGTNTVNIIVTASDGTKKTYTITVTRSKDNNANLSSLGVTGYSLSPAFASETTSYTLTLEDSSVTVTATASSSVAIVSGTGTKTLNWGSNTVNVIVTAQDGTVKTYKITITNTIPTAPVIQGGNSTLAFVPVNISLKTAGTAISGVKNYEYYMTTSTTAPTDSTTATEITSNTVTVENDGKYYIYYRTVSNKGSKSLWSSPQIVYKETKQKLSEAIFTDNTLKTTAATLTQASNAVNENGLYASTATNSGTATYFFRGNITNNYISFAGLMWKIVRINEDNTVRLILKDGINNNQLYRYSNTIIGNVKSMYYSGSVAKSTVDSWYSSNLTSYDSYLATEMYCEQSKVVYAATNRTANNEAIYTSYTPTFKCATDTLGYGIINAKVGLLSIDEARHAGIQFYVDNPTNYLTNSTGFWTMSPGGYDNASDRMSCVWPVKSTGSSGTNRLENSYALRPVINLEKDVIIYGDGTTDLPYQLSN